MGKVDDTETTTAEQLAEVADTAATTDQPVADTTD